MFCKLAVCTAVLVAVLSNDALALQQGGFFTPTTGAGQDDSYTTNNKTPMVPPQTLPSGTTAATALKATPASTSPAPVSMHPSTPTTDIKDPPVTPTDASHTAKEGQHATDCNPNFPSEKTEASKQPLAATTSVAKPTEPSQLASTLATPPTDLGKSASRTDAFSAPEELTKGSKTAQQANAQSGNHNPSSTNSSFGFITVGLVGAIAAVAAAMSHVKKTRDADAALVTPDDNENIHIEIKCTPAGGSTIL